MYIKQINIRKYRHIENLDIGPFLRPSDASDLIVFAGQTYMQKQHIWGYAFRNESEQFEDMLDFLITWQHNYFQQLGSFHHQRAAGFTDEDLGQPPVDRYGKVLSEVFPDYTFVHKSENAPSDLFVRIPSGETIPFSDLSSGEKQVFFTLCFFERHDVAEAVIVIDEPELHSESRRC